LRTVRRQDIDPVNGRYIQSDPIWFDGGVNTYLYACGIAWKFTTKTDGKTIRISGGE